MIFRSVSLARSLTRAANTTSPLLRSRQLPTAHYLLARGAASQVSGRPGSQTLPHALQNVKEEVSHTSSDLAKTIAGGADNTQFASSSKDTPINDTFAGITSAVAARVPSSAMRFGLAGALPYLGTTAASVYYANQAGQAASGLATSVDLAAATDLLSQALSVQVTYGAVMLSFLGAIHWGLEFSGYGGHKGSKRLALGIAPTLVGWATLSLDPATALITQWAGFTTLWYADMKATTAGWAPAWYSQYRFYLSILVGSCIIGTLAGNYALGPVAAHSTTTREYTKLKEERQKLLEERVSSPVGPGEIGAVSGVETGADAYVVIKHAKDPEEEKRKEEEEKKKRKWF